MELIVEASNFVGFTVHEVKSYAILDIKKQGPAHYKKTVSASDETSGKAMTKKEPFKIAAYNSLISPQIYMKNQQ